MYSRGGGQETESNSYRIRLDASLVRVNTSDLKNREVVKKAMYSCIYYSIEKKSIRNAEISTTTKYMHFSTYHLLVKRSQNELDFSALKYCNGAAFLFLPLNFTISSTFHKNQHSF